MEQRLRFDLNLPYTWNNCNNPTMDIVVGEEDLLMYKVDFLDGLFGILGNQFPETMWEYRSIYVTLTWERKTPFSIGFYTPNGYFMCSREFSYWFANQPHEKRNNWSALIWLKLKRAIMHATYWVITYEGRGIEYPMCRWMLSDTFDIREVHIFCFWSL